MDGGSEAIVEGEGERECVRHTHRHPPLHAHPHSDADSTGPRALSVVARVVRPVDASVRFSFPCLSLPTRTLPPTPSPTPPRTWSLSPTLNAHSLACTQPQRSLDGREGPRCRASLGTRCRHRGPLGRPRGCWLCGRCWRRLWPRRQSARRWADGKWPLAAIAGALSLPLSQPGARCSFKTLTEGGGGTGSGPRRL